MSIQAHLEALKEQHRRLEADLADALLHSSSSDQEIAELKHKKLALKDEIAALEAKLRSTFA
jgi:hypothetical protein